MIKAFSRLLIVLFTGICLVPLVATVCSRILESEPLWGRFALRAGLYVLLVGSATIAFYFLMRRLNPRLDGSASEQSTFLSDFSDFRDFPD